MSTKKKKTEPEIKLVKSTNPFPVVGIGASAGGLDAFKKFLSAIPRNPGMAFVFVQHLSPTHESMLPEILQKATLLPVLEIKDQIAIEVDHVYIIPENRMLVANDNILELTPRPQLDPLNKHLPIDFFFKSLAQVHQSLAVGVILSGTASDGTLGLKAIKDWGGITLAEDPISAGYPGMPQSAIEAGVVDFVLPAEKLPQKIISLVAIVNDPAIVADGATPDAEVLKQILSLLRVRKGTDFTHYKPNTIRRRLLRRMALSKYDNLEAYLRYLRENKSEQDVLYQDLLIPVTGFFRDTKTFDNLCESVFPKILKKKGPGETVRIWVAGCSTGEEVYSIAICFRDLLDDRSQKVQIFATDISEPAIAQARSGLYPQTAIEGLSHQHLQEYFTRTDGSYQVNKNVRDMCVFAVHNFLKDPPFGKMDLISCRNVLIYMEPFLQKKALSTFHYALNSKGFLLLGKSETTSSVSDYFLQSPTLDGSYDKLFVRNDIAGRYVPVLSRQKEENFGIHLPTQTSPILTDYKKAADEVLLNKYTTPGVVINESLDIVHFRGKTGNYLEPSVGKPSLNLMKMAKDELAFELRNLVHRVIKEDESVSKQGIVLQENGTKKSISIEVIPLKEMAEPHYLVLFHDDTELKPHAKRASQRFIASPANERSHDEKQQRIEQLEKELAQAREDMRSITEEQEAANEELQSANEELVSGSEELQSLNEELETGKEELQSANEELITINKELISSYEEVSEAREYADNIIATVSGPLLVLNKKLRVKSANLAFYKTFRVNEIETEGKLIFELGSRQWDIPSLRSLLEKLLPQKLSFHEFEVDMDFPNIGHRTLLLNGREIPRKSGMEKLILLSMQDITDSKLFVKESEAHRKLHRLLMQTPAAIATLSGKDHIYTMANDRYKELFSRTEEQLIGKSLRQVFPELQDILPGIFQQVWETGQPHVEQEFAANFQRNDGTWRTGYYNFILQPITDSDNKISEMMIHAYEVTEQVIARKKVEESEHRYRELILSSPSMISILKGEDMRIEIANESILNSWGKGETVMGKPLAEVMPEIIEQGFGEILREVFTTGNPYRAYETPIYQVRNGKKELGYYTFIYQPQRDLDGNIEGVAVIGHEDTPQAEYHKKLKESELRFRQLAELMPNKITTADADGTINFYSKSWEDYCGVTKEKLLSEGWFMLIHPEEHKAVLGGYNDALVSGSDFEMEFRLRNKSGIYKWHLGRFIPLKDEESNVIRWMGTLIEIQKMKEEEQRKGDFIKMVSHELKTPVTSVKGYVQLLRTMLDEQHAIPETPLRGALERIDNQLYRLTRLITEMLDLSRIEAGKLELQRSEFSINDLVAETVQDGMHTSKSHDITVQQDITCTVEADRGRIEQVLINLINNAIKYSPVEKEIKVRIFADGNYRVGVSVSDMGIGIAPEEQAKIFERFYRVAGPSESNYMGFGIGLFIANEIVQRHDGFIRVDSEKNKGSTFTFFLPIRTTTSDQDGD